MQRLLLFATAALLLVSGCCNKEKNETVSMENDVISTIIARRSIRAYKPEPVDRAIMDKIVKTAIHAPNAMNAQPWEIRVVDNPDFIEGTTKIYVEKMKADPRGARMIDSTFVNMYRNAPTVVFIAINDGRFSQIDCGILSATMMLAAKSLGVGSVPLGGPVDFFKSEEASEYYAKLNIPETHHLALIIGFGYPNQSPETKPRDESKIQWID
ncbi:MAG: nitroreductase family protein [Bacteroidales bacterium]|nr:nitroreductase family protein [Bacteroidales bacterium]MDD3200788.1 nitroreductase family protein [Bacteroidales bacterium]